MLVWLVPGGFWYIRNQNNYNSNWKKLFGFRNMQENLENLTSWFSFSLHRYRLDDCLGGSSPTIHQRAIKRIYGDKANDIIDGLKRNPVVSLYFLFIQLLFQAHLKLIYSEKNMYIWRNLRIHLFLHMYICHRDR